MRLLFILLTVLFVATPVYAQSFIQRGSSGSRIDIGRQLDGHCSTAGEVGYGGGIDDPRCENRFKGKRQPQLVPIGYDPMTGLLIMKPVYQ